MNGFEVNFVGNVTRDPELAITQQGVSAVRFSVAVSRRVKGEDDKWTDADTVFMNCTAWRDLAEHVAESVVKGTRVTVAGRLRQYKYEKDGVERTGYDCTADEVGVSLRHATAKVQKVERTAAWAKKTPPASEDPWAEPALTPVVTTADSEDPPFQWMCVKVDDLDGQRSRENHAFEHGFRLGYHGYDVGYGRAQIEMDEEWAAMQAKIRGHANEPSHAELERRRAEPGPDGEAFRHRHGGEYRGGHVGWATGGPRVEAAA